MNLPVVVVEEARQTPGLGILAESPGVEAHRRLDCQHVAPQALGLHVLLHDRQSLLSIHLSSSPGS